MSTPASGLTTLFNEYITTQQAKCRVCFDLDWECFPHRTVFDERVRTLSTPWDRLYTSGLYCKSCNLVYRAGKRFFGIENDTEKHPVFLDLYRNFAMHVRIPTYTDEPDIKLELFDDPASLGSKKFGLCASSIAQQPTVELCIAFISTNMAKCKRLHKLCCLEALPQLPKRVIDVGTSQNTIRLVESNDRRAEYVALSHCWGDENHRPIQTKQNSIKSHSAGICWTELNRTFQDAILITRGLGQRFLWIDSLCIIQDSPEDWKAQAALMGDIYNFATLTLAATASVDGDGGCLRSRDIHHNLFGTDSTGEKIYLTPGVPEDGAFFLRQPPSSHDLLYLRSGSPLAERAWVYQETMLSPRTLHFHEGEMLWECRESIECECGDFGRSGPLDFKDSCVGWKYPYLALLEGAPREDIINHWYEIVKAYSTKKLTFETDRLVAIAGLAARFSKVLRTPYIAGIWLSDIRSGLAWDTGFQGSSETKRSPSIPTWSWASILPSHGVEMLANVVGLDDEFRIIEVNYTRSKTSEFLDVSDGNLLIRGSFASVTFYKPYNIYSGGLKLGGERLDGLHPDISDFVSREISHGDTLYLLRVLCDDIDPLYGRGGYLVLKKVRGRRYRRVGFFNRSLRNCSAWSKNAVVKEIELM